MTAPLTVECNLVSGRSGKQNPSIPTTSRVPRISRLMALAIRMQNLIRAGGIADYSALAQLGHVSRARITQIMNLLLLAPDLQEQILFLPSTGARSDSVRLAQLQPIAQIPDWNQQRRHWSGLRDSFDPGTAPCPYVDNEGTGRNGPAILPGPGISIGRKTQVCTPKRYKVCHNSDKVCQNEGSKLTPKRHPNHSCTVRKCLI